MGPERKSMIMTEKEKRNTAVHEAGHALVGKLLPGLRSASTRSPSSRAARPWASPGALPTEDKVNRYKKQILDQIAMMMGGRIAEELMFDEMTSGASNDIERATETGARDGLPLGHEREARAPGLRQERGRGLPGPRLRQHDRTTPRTPRGRSTPRCAASSWAATSSGKRLLTENTRRPQAHRRRAGGVRDARRRGREHPPAGWQPSPASAGPARHRAAQATEKKDKRKILDALEATPQDGAEQGVSAAAPVEPRPSPRRAGRAFLLSPPALELAP